jgi:polynucleotide 5'-hydroxyl-kinase GRC3/NOL9
MANNHVIDSEEWSPLAPSSAAVAIGWKNRAQTPKEDTPPSNGRKRLHSDVTHAIPVARQQEYRQQIPVGTLTEQDGGSIDTSEQDRARFSVPDGLSVEWDGAAAILTFAKKPLHVCLLGRARIMVTSGEIEILGHRLDNSTEAVEIESPAWTSAITIDSQKVDTTLKVTSIRQRETERTFQILNPLQDSVRPTMIPSSWKSAMNAVLEDLTKSSNEPDEESERTKTRNARIVVCGAKHVGKSTCIRYAVNRLLSSSSFPAVALLDCDTGQPEMSPPGMLTLTIITTPLLSPPHHHMVMGEGSLVSTHHTDACFYGHTTSKADPSLFLQCIKKLLESYVRVVADKHGGDESKLPLLINTDGWVKGMGFEILSAALDSIQPNHVIQLLGEVRSKLFDLTEVLKDKATRLHKAHSYRNSSVIHDSSISVAPVAAVQSSMYRSLRLCTYFLGSPGIWDRVEFGQHGIADYDCEIGTTLASMKPYAVPMDSIQYGTIRGVDKPSDLGSEDMILDALNASIVGLCQSDIGDSSQGPNNTCISCVGLGLIRSIDRDRRFFYILTPVPFSTLQSVNVIVGGSIQIPTECLYRGIHSESFYYMSCDGISVGIGGEFMKSRNTLMRKSSSL